MKLVFDRHLQEELVRAQLMRNPEFFNAWTKRVEPIYQLPEEERVYAFASAYKAVFEELHLGQPLENLLPEFSFTRSFNEVLVVKATSPKEEGVELSRVANRLGIRLLPQRFQEPEKFNSFLRHELMHIGDMLEPAFGYQAEPLTGIAVEDHGVTQHYRLFWDIYIDGRLAQQGKQGGASQTERQREFERAFFFLPRRDRTAAFLGLWSAPGLAHSQLLEMAREPLKVVPLGKAETIPAAGPLPGSLCPLCRFPSYDWAKPDDNVVILIQSDFPGWTSDEGLCSRCYEHYSSKEVALWK